MTTDSVIPATLLGRDLIKRLTQLNRATLLGRDLIKRLTHSTTIAPRDIGLESRCKPFHGRLTNSSLNSTLSNPISSHRFK